MNVLDICKLFYSIVLLLLSWTLSLTLLLLLEGRVWNVLIFFLVTTKIYANIIVFETSLKVLCFCKVPAYFNNVLIMLFFMIMCMCVLCASVNNGSLHRNVPKAFISTYDILFFFINIAYNLENMYLLDWWYILTELCTKYRIGGPIR